MVENTISRCYLGKYDLESAKAYTDFGKESVK
jgi:hypothetical protein